MVRTKSKVVVATTASIRYGFYLVAKIEENPWNPNRMPADKYEAIREDMRRGGSAAIDPILTASKQAIFKDPSIPEDIRITIDGNHRLRIARELGWSEIREGFDLRITDRETARIISYVKNTERGEMDPYRQAEYFKWFVDHGWTHEKIAKKHRIGRTTVTKHLSLIKIDPKAREKLANVPRITISHLEPIATLELGQQCKLVKEIASEFRRESPPVRTIEHRVSRIKKEAKEAEELRRAVEKAKFPKCPTCGKPARSDSWRRLPWVRCENYHEWNLDTGPIKREKPLGLGQQTKTKKPQMPKYIRSTHTPDEFREAFGEYARRLIPRFKRIHNIRCRGTAADSGREAYVDADISPYQHLLGLRVELDGRDISLTVEPKTYKSKDLKQFKTSVSMWPEPKKKESLVKLEQLISEIFEKSGQAVKVEVASAVSKQKVGRLQNYVIPVTVDGTAFNLWLSANQLRKIRKARLKARIHIDVEIPEGERKGARR